MSELPTFEGWRVLEKMGEGGHCAVYRVESQDSPGTERAVKVLISKDSSAKERFVTEGELLGRIDHPNVVRIHTLSTLDDPPWLVMDLLAGNDLEEEMRDHGPMAPERAAWIFVGVADGLAAVHALGVRHRDIKPANIVMGSDGVPKLIDFGIAREAHAAHVTRVGFVVGTAGYLPPEIFQNPESSREVQNRETADVYALAQSMLEIVAGRPILPIDGSVDDAGLLLMAMKQKTEQTCLDVHDFNPLVPEDLAALLRKGTDQDPGKRFSTATEFGDALRSWLTARTTASHAPVSTGFSIDSIPPPPGSMQAFSDLPNEPTESRDQLPAEFGGELAHPPGTDTTSLANLQQPMNTNHSQAGARPVLRTAGKAAAGAAGAFSVTAILSTAALVAAAGVVGLWFYAPTRPPAKALAVPQSLSETLGKCRGKGVSNWRVTVSGVKADADLLTKSDVDAKCIRKVLEKPKWPKGSYSFTFPMVFPQG